MLGEGVTPGGAVGAGVPELAEVDPDPVDETLPEGQKVRTNVWPAAQAWVLESSVGKR